ncbi:hypothetical protein [Mycolicibacterium nivoides]|uniref:Uncharacterized protein n=1 Tax=Mycolicibacterium nivoides TaxID=2487344 RepID=A0ABW9LES6_9MYCO
MENEDESGKPNQVADDVGLGVGDRARIYPGTAEEQAGVVVEDFGTDAGLPVDIGDERIADAARRWAVSLDTGNLVFVDDADIVAGSGDSTVGETSEDQQAGG